LVAGSNPAGVATETVTHLSGRASYCKVEFKPILCSNGLATDISFYVLGQSPKNLEKNSKALAWGATL
jgi:hypothetical protein